jgi:hypothetical protein
MSSRGYGTKYTPGKEIEEMEQELLMMYSKYEELCKSYRALAQKQGVAPSGNLENTTKNFGDWQQEKITNQGERYGG